MGLKYSRPTVRVILKKRNDEPHRGGSTHPIAPAYQWQLHLARVLFVVLLSVSVVGCYMPNQARLEEQVSRTISTDEPLSQAIAKLSAQRFTCDSKPSSKGQVSCSRIRQRLLPSSCIERVVMTVSPNESSVSAIDVRPIVCAGL